MLAVVLASFLIIQLHIMWNPHQLFFARLFIARVIVLFHILPD